ncbi:MAG: hypothetical protein M3Y80_03860 [Verrucomicrobiota bacterium]|nr:hypothetical protein [Verrucomicrobiota bacterium]
MRRYAGFLAAGVIAGAQRRRVLRTKGCAGGFELWLLHSTLIALTLDGTGGAALRAP